MITNRNWARGFIRTVPDLTDAELKRQLTRWHPDSHQKSLGRPAVRILTALTRELTRRRHSPTKCECGQAKSPRAARCHMCGRRHRFYARKLETPSHAQT